MWARLRAMASSNAAGASRRPRAGGLPLIQCWLAAKPLPCCSGRAFLSARSRLQSPSPRRWLGALRRRQLPLRCRLARDHRLQSTACRDRSCAVSSSPIRWLYRPLHPCASGPRDHDPITMNPTRGGIDAEGATSRARSDGACIREQPSSTTSRARRAGAASAGDLGRASTPFLPRPVDLDRRRKVDGRATRVRRLDHAELGGTTPTGARTARPLELIFDIPTLIDTCSRAVTLFPGAVISNRKRRRARHGFFAAELARCGRPLPIEIDGIGAIETGRVRLAPRGQRAMACTIMSKDRGRKGKNRKKTGRRPTGAACNWLVGAAPPDAAGCLRSKHARDPIDLPGAAARIRSSGRCRSRACRGASSRFASV